MRIVPLMFLTFCFNNLLFSNFKTEDLGSVKKETIVEEKKNEAPSVDYARLKNVEAKKDEVAEQAPQSAESSLNLPLSDSDKEASEKVPFYKALGTITIRASEDYVYIRAGKSSVIMDAEGKIIIDSAKDLFLTSQNNIILKAKGDIVLRAGKKIDAEGAIEKISKETNKEAVVAGEASKN